jgi:hypothetical protein
MMQALVMTTADFQGRREATREIGEMWRRVSRTHLTSGQGCACGFGGGLMLQGADFELDIVEFLIEDAMKAGYDALRIFINEAGRRGSKDYSLPALIEALGRDPLQGLTEAEASFAIATLRKTLASMDGAHSRFACG